MTDETNERDDPMLDDAYIEKKRQELIAALEAADLSADDLEAMESEEALDAIGQAVIAYHRSQRLGIDEDEE